MSSVRTIAILLFAVALPLGGCGVKGSLDSPAQAKADGTATSADAKGSAENSSGPKKKHRPFVLDGLLR